MDLSIRYAGLRFEEMVRFLLNLLVSAGCCFDTYVLRIDRSTHHCFNTMFSMCPLISLFQATSVAFFLIPLKAVSLGIKSSRSQVRSCGEVRTIESGFSMHVRPEVRLQAAGSLMTLRGLIYADTGSDPKFPITETLRDNSSRPCIADNRRVLSLSSFSCRVVHAAEIVSPHCTSQSDV